MVLAPAAASAQEPGYVCRVLDLNGDRLIQRSEWNRVANADSSAASGGSAARGSPAFRGADGNDTGYLSDRELWRIPVRSGGGWIAVDRNRDGRIAPSEFERMSK
jgi:hypothetical protein